MINSSYRLCIEDLIELQRLTSHKLSVRTYIIGLFTCLLMISIIVVTRSRALIAILSAPILLWLLLPIAYLQIYYLIIPNQAKKTFKQLSNSQVEFDFTIYPDYIEYHSLEFGNEILQLNDFSWYRISNKTIVLYKASLQKSFVYGFPHRSFESEQDRHTFISYLEANALRQK